MLNKVSKCSSKDIAAMNDARQSNQMFRTLFPGEDAKKHTRSVSNAIWTVITSYFIICWSDICCKSELMLPRSSVTVSVCEVNGGRWPRRYSTMGSLSWLSVNLTSSSRFRLTSRRVFRFVFDVDVDVPFVFDVDDDVIGDEFDVVLIMGQPFWILLMKFKDW